MANSVILYLVVIIAVFSLAPDLWTLHPEVEPFLALEQRALRHRRYRRWRDSGELLRLLANHSEIYHQPRSGLHRLFKRAATSGYNQRQT